MGYTLLYTGSPVLITESHLDFYAFKLKGPEVPSVVQPQSETELLYLGIPMQNVARM